MGSGQNCLEAYAHFIFQNKLFLHYFYLRKYDMYLWVQKINFLLTMYFERVFETLRHSFLFNFYMICIYFILKKKKRLLLKQIKIMTTLPSRIRGYPVFPGVLLLKVTPYRITGMHEENSDSDTVVAASRSYGCCVTD